MTTDPVPGGYLDRQYAQRARQANNRCRQIVGQVVRGDLSQAQILKLLLELAFELGEQNNALHEMVHIRTRKGPGDDGTSKDVAE